MGDLEAAGPRGIESWPTSVWTTAPQPFRVDGRLGGGGPCQSSYSQIETHWQQTIQMECSGEGYFSSHPASEVGCGSHWEGDCRGAGWERELLVTPAPWKPPTLCETCRAKPKGTPQVYNGPHRLPPPFKWRNFGRGGRGCVCPEQLLRV